MDWGLEHVGFGVWGVEFRVKSYFGIDGLGFVGLVRAGFFDSCVVLGFVAASGFATGVSLQDCAGFIGFCVGDGSRQDRTEVLSYHSRQMRSRPWPACFLKVKVSNTAPR